MKTEVFVIQWRSKKAKEESDWHDEKECYNPNVALDLLDWYNSELNYGDRDGGSCCYDYRLIKRTIEETELTRDM